MNQLFDKYQSTLNKEQVINYLLHWQSLGFKVVEGRPPFKNGWSIEFAPLRLVGIRPTDYPYLFDVCCGNLLRSIGTVGTLEDLKKYFEQACLSQGIDINSPPQELHTEPNEPISMFVKLNTILNNESISAIYDPFLDNITLKNLIDLNRFGAKLLVDLKLLTSEKHRVTKNCLENFNTELSINSQLKITNKEHARLIFTNNNKCISPDFSLNKAQLGTIKEIEANQMLKFFNEAWDAAEEF